MADNAQDARAALEQQIADLKEEMAALSSSLAERAAQAIDSAGEAYDEGVGYARRTVGAISDQTRQQARITMGAMRDNPGTTATVLASVGLLGFAAGYVVAGICASCDDRPRRYRR